MTNTITTTHFNFPRQKNVYRGKVRDVYTVGDDLLVMIATDRLSAFDVVLPRGIPYKGQILNQIAVKTMQTTQNIVPNWLLASPDPNVAVGQLCEPFKVEMVIRGYLSGHAARTYKAGKRKLCNIAMPEGMKENDPFPDPIITPTTKAAKGKHDEDISREEILTQKYRLRNRVHPTGKLYPDTLSIRNRSCSKTRTDSCRYQIRIRQNQGRSYCTD